MTAPITAPRIPLVPLPDLVAIDGRLITRNDERDRERYCDADLTGYDLTASLFTEARSTSSISEHPRSPTSISAAAAALASPYATVGWRPSMSLAPHWRMWTSDRPLSQP